MSEEKNVPVGEEVKGNEQVEGEQNKGHVTFEVIKGAENEHKFYFSVPKDVSLGIAYDAAFEVLNHITKTIQDMTGKLDPKKDEEKQPEGDEK